MSVQDLLKKYNMIPHEENGSYAECHYPYAGTDRAPSGSSYFYAAPGDVTLFHRIDCDEYWCYNAGDSLEVWIIDSSGRLELRNFGTGPDSDPLLYFPKGVIFGSRNKTPDGEGTFFTCITVPRFSYSGFQLVEKGKILELCPEAKSFWE